MIVGSHHFESYLKCPTKCWLQSRAEPPAENTYAQWASTRNEAYLRAGLKSLVDTSVESGCAIAPPFPKNPKEVVWRFAIDVRWKTKDLENRLQAIERVPGNGSGRPSTFIPYRFEPLNKITKEHRLLLAFDAHRLSESVRREVRLGKIVHGDKYATLNVQTVPFAKDVRKLTNDITALLTRNTPPDLVLNPTLSPVRVPKSVPHSSERKGRTQPPVRHVGARPQEASRQGHLHSYPVVPHISSASTPQGVER